MTTGIDPECGTGHKVQLGRGVLRQHHTAPVPRQPLRERRAGVEHLRAPNHCRARGITAARSRETCSRERIHAQQLQRLVADRHVTFDDGHGAHRVQGARQLSVQRGIDARRTAIEFIGGRSLHGVQ